MKKFLTVLLVIAVMFTFSFGSAFAASDANTVNANINTAQTQVVATFTTNYNNAVASLTDAAVGSVAVSKASWVAGAEKYYDTVIKSIDNKTEELKKAIYDANPTVNDLVKSYEGIVLSQTDMYEAIVKDANVQQAAIYAEFDNYKAAAVAALNAVDLTIYSTTTPTTGDTYYEQAEAIITAALKTVNGTTVKSTDGIDAIEAAIKKIGTIAAVDSEATKSAKGTGALAAIKTVVDTDNKVVTGYALFKSIKTIATEAAEAVTLEAQKAAALSQVNANAAKFLAENATASASVLAKVNTEKAAYVDAMTEIINAAADKDELAAITNPLAAPSTAYNYTANAEKIAALEKVAAKYKAYKDADGNYVMDADKINEIVAAAKVAAYKTNAEWAGYDDAVLKIQAAKATNVVVSNDAIELEKAEIEADRTAALENYYELEKAAVNAYFDELLVKVTEAKSDDDVAKVYTKNAYKKASALTGKDKASVQDAIKKTAGYTNNETAIEAYITYLTTVNTGDNTQDFSKYQAEGFWANWYAEAGARTSDEVAALLDTAKAELAAVPTAAELAAQKAAVEAAIKALPTTITAADAAAVEAAYEACVAYNEAANLTMANTNVSNIGSLNLAISSLAAVEKKAVEADITAALKADDKDVLKAAKETAEAYNAKVATGKIYENQTAIATATIKKIDDALDAIRADELQAVKNAVNDLPFNITLADKAAVEAARALYDAYVAEYTDYAAKDLAATQLAAEFKVIQEAEAAIAAAMAENAKSVEALKITASSTAKKGSITVKWTVKGDTSAVQGWEIWKSTKKNSGYSKSFTQVAEKQTYKNTKGLKKGTRYYYKVRAIAYTADGTKVKSDWSNKAYRIAK